MFRVGSLTLKVSEALFVVSSPLFLVPSPLFYVVPTRQPRNPRPRHPERSEGSPLLEPRRRFLAPLEMTKGGRSLGTCVPREDKGEGEPLGIWQMLVKILSKIDKIY
jgi:hypothetical protein